MFPRATLTNTTNSGRCHAETFRENGQRCIAWCCPDGANIVFSKNGIVDSLTTSIRIGADSTLRGFISHVVIMGSKEQMIRPNARRIVAPMKDLHSCRNRTDDKLVGIAMGTDNDLKSNNGPISVSLSSTFPHPTSVAFFNSRPKLILRRIREREFVASVGAVTTPTFSDIGAVCKERSRARFANARNVLVHGMFGVRHLVASLQANEVRRARTASTVPGFSLPKLYQIPGIF